MYSMHYPILMYILTWNWFSLNWPHVFASLFKLQNQIALPKVDHVLMYIFGHTLPKLQLILAIRRLENFFRYQSNRCVELDIFLPDCYCGHLSSIVLDWIPRATSTSAKWFLSRCDGCLTMRKIRFGIT